MMYLLCSLGTELSSLDMQHQVSTADVLHDEVDSSFRLEAGMKVEQEGVPLFVGNQEHPLLRACAFNFVILDDELLLQHLNGVQLLRALGLCQHNLTKVTLSKDRKEIEVIQSYPSSSSLRVCWWRHLVFGSLR